MNLSELFETHYVGPFAAANTQILYDLCNNAEVFIFNSLLDHHELPHKHPSDCCFTMLELSRQVPDDKLVSIWEETKEKFPPQS